MKKIIKFSLLCFIVVCVSLIAYIIKLHYTPMKSALSTQTFSICQSVNKMGVMNTEGECQPEDGLGCFAGGKQFGILKGYNCRERDEGDDCLTFDLKEGKLVSWERYKKIKQVCEVL